MLTIEEIRSFYKQLASREAFKDFGEGMLILSQQLAMHLDVLNLTSRFADAALTFKTPNARQTVHVAWHKGDHYIVYLDYCGDTEETFYGEKRIIPLESVILTIREYLERLESSKE